MANFLKNLGKEALKARTKALRAVITRRPHELAMFELLDGYAAFIYARTSLQRPKSSPRSRRGYSLLYYFWRLAPMKSFARAACTARGTS